LHRAREYERTLLRTPGPERTQVIAEALSATKVLPESEIARREVVCLRASLGLELGDTSVLSALLVDLMDARVFTTPTERQLGLIVKLERALATGSAPPTTNAEPPPHPPALPPSNEGVSRDGHGRQDPPPFSPGHRDGADTETGTSSGRRLTDRPEPPPPRSFANILGWVLFLSGLIIGPVLTAVSIAREADRASTEGVVVIGWIGGLLLDLVGTILIGATSRGRRDRWWLLCIWLAYLLVVFTAYRIAVPPAASPRSP
jgi:hypothetical protein